MKYLFHNLRIQTQDKKVTIIKVVVFLLAISVAGIIFWPKYPKPKPPGDLVYYETPKEQQTPSQEETMKKTRPKPGPISMSKMKNQGCVADGLLSGYGGDTNEAVRMIKDSNCQYLHRALETWLSAPDFEKAGEIMDKIDRQDITYGMFIAEALNKKAELYYPDENRYFDFNDMCGPNTQNDWGEHTCKPNFKREEYRKYVVFITKQAMDLGVQSFEFGQIYYQDTDKDHSDLLKVISDMRDYAKKSGVQIAIGAQTNTITDEKYLKNFDYIEGGVGIHPDGSIEDGPCLSRWYKGPGDYCWALLWNQRYADSANNVFLHLDWSGIIGDDMSNFTKMDSVQRAKILENLHSYFTSRHFGFLMPMMATLSKNNGGCHGKKDSFYSASDAYSCQDEYAINSILKNK